MQKGIGVYIGIGIVTVLMCVPLAMQNTQAAVGAPIGGRLACYWEFASQVSPNFGIHLNFLNYNRIPQHGNLECIAYDLYQYGLTWYVNYGAASPDVYHDTLQLGQGCWILGQIQQWGGAGGMSVQYFRHVVTANYDIVVYYTAFFNLADNIPFPNSFLTLGHDFCYVDNDEDSDVESVGCEVWWKGHLLGANTAWNAPNGPWVQLLKEDFGGTQAWSQFRQTVTSGNPPNYQYYLDTAAAGNQNWGNPQAEEWGAFLHPLDSQQFFHANKNGGDLSGDLLHGAQEFHGYYLDGLCTAPTANPNAIAGNQHVGCLEVLDIYPTI